MQQKFKADEEYWPRGKWSTFLDLVFKDVGIQYKFDTHEILEKLQQDLSDRGSYQYINLRKLRNQIMKQDKVINSVFGWGLNDERLCRNP